MTRLPADAIVLLLVDWTFGTETLSAMTPALTQVEAAPVARLHPDEITRLGLPESEDVTDIPERKPADGARDRPIRAWLRG